jgi:hypothetical protein
MNQVRNYAFIPAGLLILLHLLMTYYVLPLKGDVLRVYVASRGGGSAYYLTPNEFLTTNAIAIGVALLGAVLIVLLAYFKKRRSVLATGFILFTATTFYISIFLGYALEVFWGGWGEVVGVVVPLGLWVLLTWPIMLSGLETKKR